MIVYGTVTGESVGDLFIGGIGPGIVWGVIVMAYSYYIAKVRNVPTQKRASIREIINALKDSIWALGVPIIIIGEIYGGILTRQQIPQALAESLIVITNSKVTILLMMNLILLIAGMFIDPASSTTILAPLFLPLAINYGIDPIHLGIIMVVNGAIGMFTPPFGLNLFVATGVSKEPISKIISGSMPFVFVALVTMALVTFVPQITLFLVHAMR